MKQYRLYSDFNCPFCYAMHERLHALGVMEEISWQGVQHAPHLPMPMVTWAGHLGAELRQEVEMVRRLAPELTIAVPKGKPNTRPTIAVSARALRADPLRARDFIRSIYRLFWVDGQDLSDEGLLQRKADRHGLPGAELVGPAAGSVDQVLRDWGDQWGETEHQGVPLLQRSDAQVLVGLVPMETLKRFLAGE